MTEGKLKTEVCPICQKPTHPDFAPFCSKACKAIDLLHWLNEDYRVPSEEPITEDSEETPKIPPKE